MYDMDTAPDWHNPEPEFVAELTPYRSLGSTGFFLLMVFVGGSCFFSGILFLLMGAWPVFLFMLLDALIIWGAFKLNYRAARAKERVYVGKDELKVEKYDPSGRRQDFIFNPFWTRFEVERHEEFGVINMQLVSKDKRVVVGAFLNPEDKESFASAFGKAIATIKS